jgi:hypothetical protein
VFVLYSLQRGAMRQTKRIIYAKSYAFFLGLAEVSNPQGRPSLVLSNKPHQKD